MINDVNRRRVYSTKMKIKGKNVRDEETHATRDLLDSIQKDELTDRMVEELPVLRARLGMSQKDLGDILGMARQHVSTIENRRCTLPWNTYLSMLMVFSYNEKTREEIERAGLFPESLKQLLNTDLRKKVA